MLQTLAPELASQTPGQLKLARLPHLRSIVRLGADRTPGMQNYGSVLALAGPAQRARLDMVAAGLDPDEAINIQFTSGTTGLPKGATLTHYNIVNNVHFLAQQMNFSAQDRLCTPERQRTRLTSSHQC